MSEHVAGARMHDLLDGLLPEHEADRVRAHLDTCPECREEYGLLARVVAELGALPQEASTPESVWTGIERVVGDSIRREDEASGVLALSRRRRPVRRFTFSVPQLAAAAVVVSTLSAGAMWMAVSSRVVGHTPVATAPPAPAGLGPAARMAASGEVAYEQALVELEAIVERGRDVLAPETLENLDRSLRAIDQATEDIRRALEEDPNSELLARLLVNQQRSRLRVLRQAAVSVQTLS